MDYMKRLRDRKISQGELSLMWMGQAGFLLRNSKGKVMAMDLYLSNRSERLDGNKRLTPPLVEADEMKVDVILATHCHTDHLDLDSIPVMLSEDTNLYCCEESYAMCENEGLPMERITAMKVGDTISDSGYHVEAVFADHGDTASKALGFLIETDGIIIYFTGDTNFQHKRMSYVTEKDIDILIVPINGEYGNMNERDAAMMAAQTKANLTVPCHFWTFARHEGRPYDFLSEIKYTEAKTESYVMAQGECITYSKNKENGGLI